jgi:hypothetical protein
MCLFSCLSSHITTAISCNPVSVSSQSSQHGFEQLWKEARYKDQVYQSAWKAVKDGETMFPTALDLRLSISECKIDDLGNLLYQNQRWIPESKPLRTGIIHAIHTSRALGYPGRNLTYQAIACVSDVRYYLSSSPGPIRNQCAYAGAPPC